MNYETLEHHLTNLFLHLRRGDEERAPSFGHVLSQANQQQGTSRRRSLVFAVAVVAVCAAAASLFLMPHTRRSSDEEFVATLETATTLARWAAPTDVLLEPPVHGYLSSVPRLGETFSDMNITFE